MTDTHACRPRRESSVVWHPEQAQFLTTNGVAAELAVSPMRIRQMVGEGKLPAPTNLGTRFYVWHRADIEYVRARLAGESLSVASSVLSPPPCPLRRIRDEVLAVAVDRLCGPAPVVAEVHVRIWHGFPPEGPRTVVVLGELHQGLSVYAHRGMVMAAVAPLLPVPPNTAVWFLYTPTCPGGRAQRVDNLILTACAPTKRRGPAAVGRVRHLFDPTGPGSASPTVAQLRPTNVAEIDRVVGSSVEAYPAPAYTRSTIERWGRSGRTVEVEHDMIEGTGPPPPPGATPATRRSGYVASLPRLMRAAHTLHTVAARSPDPVGPGTPLAQERREVLHAATWLLVDEVRMRRAVTATRHCSDGTTAASSEAAAGWPSTWAARLVPLTASAADKVLTASYPQEFPIPPDPGERTPLHTLLTQLRDWATELDQWAEHPDSRLHEELTAASELLAFYLGVYNSCFAHRDHPADLARLHAVTGRYDRAYLDGLRPVTITPGTDHARTYRILLDTLRGSVDDPALVGHGLDPEGRVVLHYPAPPTPEPATTPTGQAVVGEFGGHRRGQRCYAVRWPLTVPAAPIAAGTRIVADAAPGDRPVYLVAPDTTLTPLPADPSPAPHNPWTFGYSGGCDALTGAIISAFSRADRVAVDRMPAAWIDDQLTYPHDEDLNIAVDELRRRYR